jgi:GxxExxY protein
MMVEGRGAFGGDHAELTERVIGIFFRVANELGFGFNEAVYRRAMCVALRRAGLAAEEEVAIPVWF